MAPLPLPFRSHGFSTLLVLGCLAAAPLIAQTRDVGPTGPILTFGVGLRLEASDNADLDVVNSRHSERVLIPLSFSLFDETPVSRLAFSGSVDLRKVTGTSTDRNGIANPSLDLTYGHDWADASLTASASLKETDLSTDPDVTNFDGNHGTRRSLDVGAGLTLWDDRPFGLGLNAGWTDNRYSSAPGQIDNHRFWLGVTPRFNLSDTTQLKIGLRADRYDEDGPAAPRDTRAVDANLIVTRPRGEFRLYADLVDTEDGRRESLGFGQSVDMPTARFSYDLGATRGVTGKTRLTGSLQYDQELPLGSLTLALERDVNSSPDNDTERTVSSARIGYSHELNPLSQINLSLNWAEQQESVTGLTTTNANFDATYSRALTADWMLDLGYRRRLRDDITGRANSNTIFLGLRRDFVTGF